MSKSTNPYSPDSLYGKLMAHVIGKCKGITTRSGLVAYAMKNLKRTKASAMAAVGVVLSPRAEGTTKGDCRGNFSAAGHVYFMEPLKRKTGEEQRLRYRVRNPALEPNKRPATKSKVTQKKKSTKAKSKTRSRSKAKA